MVFNVKDDTELRSGIRLITKPTIYVDESIDDTFRRVAREIKGAEFSFFYKLESIEGWEFTVDPDGFFPRQRSTASHIEYDEPRPSFDYRVVIHRHPDNCNNFSPDDNNFINVNFDISLIWTERDGFVRAQLNWLNEGDRMVLPADVIVTYDTSKETKKYLKKIKPLTYNNPKPLPPIPPMSQILMMDIKSLPEHKGSEDNRKLDNYNDKGAPINQTEITDEYQGLSYEYSDEVITEQTLDALIEEDNLISDIMDNTDKPVQFERVMDFVHYTYKDMKLYNDFENLVFSYVRIALLGDTSFSEIYRTIWEYHKLWKDEKYDAVIQSLLSREKIFIASDTYTKAKELCKKGGK